MEDYAVFSKFYHHDISYVTKENNNFRKVLATTPNMQLVVMCLRPNEEIGLEVHPYNTQFFRIESGEGIAVINDKQYELYDDVVVIVPLNTMHNIINTSKTAPLKLYTIYSPPHHPSDRIDKIKDN
jgi:mannose-6-phosphate isomerase-like protein (cupin superfamily)